MKERGAANEEIISLRSAASSSAREARRAQKAASRATTRGINTPFSATGRSTPQHTSSVKADSRGRTISSTGDNDAQSTGLPASVEDEAER